MGRSREGRTPNMFSFRRLTKDVKVNVVSEKMGPTKEHVLQAGIRIEIIKTQGGITAFGLLDEKRTSDIQELLMFSAREAILFERSEAI